MTTYIVSKVCIEMKCSEMKRLYNVCVDLNHTVHCTSTLNYSTGQCAPFPVWLTFSDHTDEWVRCLCDRKDKLSVFFFFHTSIENLQNIWLLLVVKILSTTEIGFKMNLNSLRKDTKSFWKIERSPDSSPVLYYAYTVWRECAPSSEKSV